MKTTYIVLAVCLVLSFSGCASQPTVQIKRSEDNLRKEANGDVVKDNVIRKLDTLRGDEFKKMNALADYLVGVRGTNKQIVLMVIEDKGFPPQLEEILAGHPLLNTLPRDPRNLFVLESTKVPGCKNVYYVVTAEQMGDSAVSDWLPKNQKWLKFIDLKANHLNMDANSAYLTLLWRGNAKWNPDLIALIEGKDLPKGQQWDYSRILHPRDTKNKRIFLPLATMTPVLQEFF